MHVIIRQLICNCGNRRVSFELKFLIIGAQCRGAGAIQCRTQDERANVDLWTCRLCRVQFFKVQADRDSHAME